MKRLPILNCIAAEAPKLGFDRDVAHLCGAPSGDALPGSAVYSHLIPELIAPFRVIASTADCAIQAFAYGTRPVWGTQFHPEMTFELGTAMLQKPEQLRWSRVLLQNFFGGPA